MIKKPKIEYLPNIWIISFTDLLSVLLIFFLLILSSNLRLAEKADVKPQTNNDIKFNNAKANNIIDLDYLETLLKDKINNKTMNNNVKFFQEKHRLIIRINSVLLLQNNMSFDKAKELFEIIAFHLREINNKIGLTYKIAFVTPNSPQFELLYPKFLSAEKLFQDIKKLVDTKIYFGFEVKPRAKEDNFLEYLDIIIDDY